MRLVSYNILDGGVGRADPLAEVIEAQRPDIVALVEADDHSVVERIARRLKMDFVIGAGRRHGAAICSRWRIDESINHSLLREDFSDCLLEATIAGQWTLAAVHLHPRAREQDESRREAEVQAILDIFRPHRQSGRAHLLAGDFNANSPIQRIDPQKCKPRTREDIAANGGVLPRRAVQKLLDEGYVDCLHAVVGSDAANVGSFTTQCPGQRVDYVFAWGVSKARMKEARIEQGRLAKDSSDHFPIVVEIE
jgi:endonuclease/exonuclease/phosphatase family metal-dependent hydrolase